MKVGYYGSMTPTLTSHLVSTPDRHSSRKTMTQCPGITNKQGPGITKQCSGILKLQIIVMRASERPLISSPAPRGLTLTSRILVSVTQCPGLIYRVIKKQFKCVNKQLALLSPLREKGIVNIEGRGVRKRERKEVRHLFMMRAGPVSAQETHPVPAFHHK